MCYPDGSRKFAAMRIAKITVDEDSAHPLLGIGKLLR
jgi:hypothetical protein